MAKPNEDVLEFSVAIDIKNALKEMTKVQNQMAKLTKEILKSSGKTSKEQTKSTEKAKQETKEVRDSVDDLADAYEEEGKQVSNLSRVIQALEKRVKKLTGTERDAAEQRLALLKKEEAKRAEAEGEEGKREKKRREPKKPPDYSFSRKNIKKFKAEFKELGSALKEPLEAFIQRDLKGLLEGSMKGAGATLSRSLKLSRFLSGAGAEALSKRGEQMSFKGKSAGGRKGAMLEAGGAGMKRMGSMMGQVGNAMGSLAKLGPIIGMASGAMMSLVKLFLDADAGVKEFNKGILDSAGNLSIFERSGRDATSAGIHLEDTLKELRDAAFDYKTNLSLGITKEDHKAMLNTLTQEGVSLGRIEDEAQVAGKSVRELATQFTVTGVAYSRAFGVSLAEVGQFQAEMMTELGKSADETQQAFALMARGAAESGLSSNKFFAAIRGISPDLGLFNLRLEDSVAVLSKISKVMSPRNAQKFMQEAVSGLKTMGRQEKLRLSLFAGSGKTKGVVERDIERKTKNLIKKLTKNPEEAKALRAAFEKQGYAGIKSSIDKLGPEVSGSLAESAIDLQLQKKQASKGQYGTAMATADLGVGGGLELQQKALMSLAGGYKSINEAIGSMDLEAVAEALGKSDEQVKQMAKLELAIDAQREDLKAHGKSAEEVNSMGYDEIIDSMSDQMQQSLKGEDAGLSMDKKMEKLAQTQGNLTQSILDQFQVLMDWLTNQFYSVMMDIWDAVTSILHPFGAEEKATKRTVFDSGNNDMAKALKESGGDMNQFKGNLLQGGSGFSKNMMGTLGRAYQPGATKQDEFASRSVQDAINDRIGPDVGKIMAAAGAVIKDQGRLNKIKAAAEGGAGLTGSLDQGQLTGQERQDVLGQATWQLSPLQLATLGQVIDVFKRGATAPAVGGAAGAGPSSPAQSTAAAAETTNEHLADVVDDGKKQQALMTQQGIKIAPTTIKEENKGAEAAMLSALRTALFEFYMYSATDRSTLLSAMKAGGVSSPGQMAPYFAGKSLDSGSTTGAVAGLAAGEARPNASGGMVTGIANGMAMVASHGEGLASVGRGERIVPAGGGGGHGVHVSVNGIGGQDLARMIEGKVVDGIREYKRRERLY